MSHQVLFTRGDSRNIDLKLSLGSTEKTAYRQSPNSLDTSPRASGTGRRRGRLLCRGSDGPVDERNSPDAPRSGESVPSVNAARRSLAASHN